MNPRSDLEYRQAPTRLEPAAESEGLPLGASQPPVAWGKPARARAQRHLQAVELLVDGRGGAEDVRSIADGELQVQRLQEHIESAVLRLLGFPLQRRRKGEERRISQHLGAVAHGVQQPSLQLRNVRHVPEVVAEARPSRRPRQLLGRGGGESLRGDARRMERSVAAPPP